MLKLKLDFRGRKRLRINVGKQNLPTPSTHCISTLYFSAVILCCISQGLKLDFGGERDLGSILAGRIFPPPPLTVFLYSISELYFSAVFLCCISQRLKLDIGGERDLGSMLAGRMFPPPPLNVGSALNYSHRLNVKKESKKIYKSSRSVDFSWNSFFMWLSKLTFNSFLHACLLHRLIELKKQIRLQ